MIPAGCCGRCDCPLFVQREFTDVRTHPYRLEQPVHWKKGKRIFVNSMSDLFHEDVPFEFIDKVFAVMDRTPQHTYQILTKRPEQMLEYVLSHGKDAIEEFRFLNPTGCNCLCHDTDGDTNIEGGCEQCEELHSWPLPNVWLGVSVENDNHRSRIEALARTPAAVRFVSYEPALGPLNLDFCVAIPSLNWVIFGGESGPGARPCNLQWARDVRDQCKATGVPFFFKQGGRAAYREVGGTIYHYGFRDRKGEDLYEIPEDLRIREFPK